MNSFDDKHSALTETRVFGYPKWEKSSSSIRMVAFVESADICWKQEYVLRLSISTNQSDPQKLIAWFMWSWHQGFSGGIQGLAVCWVSSVVQHKQYIVNRLCWCQLSLFSSRLQNRLTVSCIEIRNFQNGEAQGLAAAASWVSPLSLHDNHQFQWEM